MKIGLVGNNQEIKDILKLFSNIAIKSIGIFSSENEKINIKKINIKYYFDFDKLLNNSDAIFFLSEEKSFFEFAKKTIQQSKHIFINNISNLTQETTKQLFKLSAEAKTNIQIRKTQFFNPIFNIHKKQIKNPKLIEIQRKNKPDTTNKNTQLISDIAFVLKYISTNIKKINSFSIPSYNLPDSYYISLEFNNKSIANITTNSLAEKNDLQINIFQTGSNISFDYKHKTCNIIDNTGINKNKESLRKKSEKPEILELKDFLSNCKYIEQNNEISNNNEQNLILTYLQINNKIN